MSAYVIIPLGIHHIPGILPIERACFSVPWSAAAFYSDLAAEPSRWYGAAEEESGILAAFLGAHVFGDEAEIVNVATHPEHRRRGIAAALLREFFTRNPAVTRTFLEVRKSNIAARRLYESFGFAEYGFRRNYYEQPVEDAVLMRKIL